MNHQVTVAVQGRTLRAPMEYSIDIDLLQPADAFSFAVPLDHATLEACPLDGAVSVHIDGIPQVTGFIERRRAAAGRLEVSGRDRTGRLCDTSVPGVGAITTSGRLLSEVILEIVRPWYTHVSFSNAADRRLKRGKTSGSVGPEPALSAAQARSVGRFIEAGTTRIDALERILSPLRLLHWGGADATTLVVARPQYDQDASYVLAERMHGRSNVLSMSTSEDSQTLYGEIEVSGSGRQPEVPLPSGFTGPTRKYVWRSFAGRAEGTGLLYPKRLFVVSDLRTKAEAQSHAERLLRQASARADTVHVVAPGHGQAGRGETAPTLFAVDTVARLYREIETAPGDDRPTVQLDREMYCNRVTFTGAREREQTDLYFTPIGAELQ